ncbi:gag-asp_proteas domain-containing protein [Cucumis melo var. makuwa]|uniref:Gag-asp_proteas domain-containing protein n=1 Tax=Cucumis melo var. makuwa TaxID=1194695 RepID=A0A5A7TEK9_CUCMM|nr:gag-asp_proteas domain-containing protein [Cucumis melo var. makuwa]TYK27030.1 gag-asp_proteas domain-containing protein [Cucumis melo var. makuwa]
MLDIRDMSEKDKVFCFVEGLKPWARAKLYEQRVQDLTSVYAAAKRLFDLTSDSQDVRRHQSSSPGRNRNGRPSSPKVGEGDECPESRRLRLRWEKDSGRMKAVNFVALPIVGLAKRTTIKLGGWKGLVDFVVVKMDDFDVVLGMEFLLEHQLIPMPSAKCLAITRSFPTVVQIFVSLTGLK